MNEKNEKILKTRKKTKTPKKNERIFSDTFRMETETIYHEDGQISVFPCDFELGQQITAGGGTVHLKAGVTINPDGQIGIRPYRHDCGIRYQMLFHTEHGCVKDTKGDIIIKLQFHKKNGRLTVADMLEDEVDDMINYLETTKEVKEWQ